MLAGPLLHPADRGKQSCSRFYRTFIEAAPNELARVFASLRSAPPLDWVPPHVRGTDVLMLIPCYSGDLRDGGEALLRPGLRTFQVARSPTCFLGRTSYLGHQSLFEFASVPHHWGYYWKSHYLPPLTDASIDLLVERAWLKTSRASYTPAVFTWAARDRRKRRRMRQSRRAGRGRCPRAQHQRRVRAGGGPWHADIDPW